LLKCAGDQAVARVDRLVAPFRQIGVVARPLDADGFVWNGQTYASLSKVAFAITGTRWNGPKFFGLRDKPSKGSTV
jgi:hypothetical protein